MPDISVDFHTHLLEKKADPVEYWKAARAKKLDAVAITEHSQKNPEKAYNDLLQCKPSGIELIPGIELETEIGHVIALSKSRDIYLIDYFLKKRIPIKKAVSVAEKKGVLLSIAHPWGLSYDSAAYILGERKLRSLVEKEKIGVEAFNGMFGSISSFFYASSWIRKPMNFFDFLEKNRVAKKTKISRLAEKGNKKLDKKGREIIERCIKPFQLGQSACFVTAGSDAHKPDRIGTGMAKLSSKGCKAKDILEAVQEKKNIKWMGPGVKETQGGFRSEKIKLQKMEILSGLKYAAKRTVLKKVGAARPRPEIG